MVVGNVVGFDVGTVGFDVGIVGFDIFHNVGLADGTLKGVGEGTVNNGLGEPVGVT